MEELNECRLQLDCAWVDGKRKKKKRKRLQLRPNVGLALYLGADGEMADGDGGWDGMIESSPPLPWHSEGKGAHPPTRLMQTRTPLSILPILPTAPLTRRRGQGSGDWPPTGHAFRGLHGFASQQITALVMLLALLLLLLLSSVLLRLLLLLCWRLVIASCRHFACCGCEVVCVLPGPGIVTVTT